MGFLAKMNIGHSLSHFISAFILRLWADMGLKNMSEYDQHEDKSQNDGVFSILDEEPEVTPK